MANMRPKKFPPTICPVLMKISASIIAAIPFCAVCKPAEIAAGSLRFQKVSSTFALLTSQKWSEP